MWNNRNLQARGGWPYPTLRWVQLLILAKVGCWTQNNMSKWHKANRVGCPFFARSPWALEKSTVPGLLKALHLPPHAKFSFRLLPSEVIFSVTKSTLNVDLVSLYHIKSLLIHFEISNHIQFNSRNMYWANALCWTKPWVLWGIGVKMNVVEKDDVTELTGGVEWEERN